MANCTKDPGTVDSSSVRLWIPLAVSFLCLNGVHPAWSTAPPPVRFPLTGSRPVLLLSSAMPQQNQNIFASNGGKPSHSWALELFHNTSKKEGKPAYLQIPSGDISVVFWNFPSNNDQTRECRTISGLDFASKISKSFGPQMEIKGLWSIYRAVANSSGFIG